MSLLPGGQPLDRVLPDLDELLEDPHAYLSEAPLAIGPRRMYGLAWLFALPGLALLLSCLFAGQGLPEGDRVARVLGERVALGVGLLIGAAVWAGWSLLMRGHEIVLHPDGVEVNYFDTTVRAPWALFHVEGRPFVPDSDNPRGGLTLPIDPRMVPYVHQHRFGVSLAWGRHVAGPQWRFSGRDEVILPARYEVASLDIAELLLVLGHRLGADKPRDQPPNDSEMLPPGEIALDPNGWFTLPLTRLRMPACCARCGGPRDDTLGLRAMARGDWLLGMLVGGARGAEVRVPVCRPCKELIESRQRRGGFLGLSLGAVGGVLTGLGLAAALGDGRDVPLWLGTLFGFFLGAMVGSSLGISLTRRLPVRLRNYSPSRGLVSVRFENPEVATHVLESLRLRERADDSA